MSESTRPTGVGLRLSVIVAGSLALLIPACGGESGPEMARVQGTVTYKGQPVKQGVISFVPRDATAPGASSPISSDGQYNLQTQEPGDGARLGDYRVIVSGFDPKILDTIKAPGTPVERKSDIPKKYENPDTSGLTATVKSGSNSFNFPLE